MADDFNILDTSPANRVLVSIQYLTTVGAGTYTRPTGVTAIEVECFGAGGGGGGSDGAAVSAAAAGGGAEGGFGKKFIENPDATYPYVVGAKGAKGAAGANAGSAGADTTFGTGPLVQGAGGNGGEAGPTRAAAGVTGLATGGTTNIGDVTCNGSPGQAGFVLSTTAVLSGSGADGPYGTGGKGTNNGDGANATGYGAGGSGAASIGNTDNQGGDGAPGLIIVREYGDAAA